MINLKIIRDAGFAGKASPPDAGRPVNKGKGKGGIKGGGKKSSGGALASIKTGLLAWYDMEEADDTTHVDAHGSNDLDYVDTLVAQSTGKVGTYCSDFTSGAVHNVSTNNIPDGANDWSTCFWVNFDALPAVTLITAVSKTAENLSANGSDGWHVGYRPGEGAMDVTIRVSATRHNCNASTFGAMSTGTWYLVYAYHDTSASEIGISINGGTIDTNTYTGTPNSYGTFGLGRWGRVGSFPYYLDGKLDSVGVWNRPLTQDEITALYNSGSGVAYSDLP